MIPNYQLLENKGIRLGNRQSGQLKTVCPQCSESRRNKTEKCLSVDIDKGVYNCHHCEWKGGVSNKPVKEYVKPLPRLEKLSKKSIEYFEKRGISNDTLLRMKITEAKEWMPQFEKEATCICFNYFKNEQLVNIKFRGPEKSFKLSKDSELIFYNLDATIGENSIVIVEGEIDCLTLIESGIYNVVSVPNGASKGSQRLEYLDNCWEYFEHLDKVILFTDNDEPGKSLKDELARRIGYEKCRFVVIPEDCKDANDVLKLHGKEKLKEIINASREYPIDGIIPMDDLYEDVVNFYQNGYPEGLKLDIGGFDECLNLSEGQLTIVTGAPGSGKSEFVDYLISRTVLKFDWTWLMCSFETKPSIHVSKLQEKIVGKAFSFRKDNIFRIQPSEFESSIGLIDKNFYFMNSDKSEITLDYLIEKAKELVKRRGIKGILIDPWNWIEHNLPKGQSETSYISEALTKIQKFVKSYNVHCFLIAHPTKLQKDKQTGKYEIPTLYSISGSAHFFNKTDNGFTIVRDFNNNQVDVYIQKVKNYWNGKIGCVSFDYNTDLRQYENCRSVF